MPTTKSSRAQPSTSTGRSKAKVKGKERELDDNSGKRAALTRKRKQSDIYEGEEDDDDIDGSSVDLLEEMATTYMSRTTVKKDQAKAAFEKEINQMIRDSDETIQTLVDANQDNLDKAIETSKKNLRDSSVSSGPVSLKHLDELLLLHQEQMYSLATSLSSLIKLSNTDPAENPVYAHSQQLLEARPVSIKKEVRTLKKMTARSCEDRSRMVKLASDAQDMIDSYRSLLRACDPR